MLHDRSPSPPTPHLARPSYLRPFLVSHTLRPRLQIPINLPKGRKRLLPTHHPRLHEPSHQSRELLALHERRAVGRGLGWQPAEGMHAGQDAVPGAYPAELGGGVFLRLTSIQNFLICE